LDTNILRFVRKGAKEDELPVGSLKLYLTRLLRTKIEVDGALGDWQTVGQILSLAEPYMALYRLVKRVAREGGLNEDLWTPHQLRHAFATRMHADGASIAAIREALNHTSITTTQRYVNVELEDVAKYIRGAK
jgi:site-specific recombinase XerC